MCSSSGLMSNQQNNRYLSAVGEALIFPPKWKRPTFASVNACRKINDIRTNGAQEWRQASTLRELPRHIHRVFWMTATEIPPSALEILRRTPQIHPATRRCTDIQKLLYTGPVCHHQSRPHPKNVSHSHSGLVVVRPRRYNTCHSRSRPSSAMFTPTLIPFPRKLLPILPLISYNTIFI